VQIQFTKLLIIQLFLVLCYFFPPDEMLLYPSQAQSTLRSSLDITYSMFRKLKRCDNAPMHQQEIPRKYKS
jgi:hypothetical protein